MNGRNSSTPTLSVPHYAFLARALAALFATLVCAGALFAQEEEHFYRDNTSVEIDKKSGVTSVSTTPDLRPGKPGASAGCTYFRSGANPTYVLEVFVVSADPFNVIGCSDQGGTQLPCKLKNMDLIKKTGLYLASIDSLISRTYLDAIKAKDHLSIKVATDGPAVRANLNPALVRAFLKKVDETEKVAPRAP